MSNTLLTPTAVTREALRVLHQKLNFVGNINRQYDDSFAKTGAKIGSDLKIRKPNKYVVTDGRIMTAQDTTEDSVTLQVTSQKHVGMNFTSAELTLSLDDFSKRIIEPAMAVLAATIEADALSMYKDVYQQVNNQGSAATFRKLLDGRAKLVDALAPAGGWIALLHTTANSDMVDALKGLFHKDAEISKQYKDGMMGHTSSFDFYENTLLSNHTSGSDADNCTINGANQTGATITIANGSSKTFKKGDIVTLPGVNRVHPETKADTGVAQQFVVTSDVTAGGTSLPISPSVIITGATQTVSASPTDSGTVDKVGTASQVYQPSLLFHPDAFTFATADLVMPEGASFAARKVQDGISMRIWKQGDIVNDTHPCRVDVLYGFKTIRPELAARFANN